MTTGQHHISDEPSTLTLVNHALSSSRWIIGPLLALGGFGEVYAARRSFAPGEELAIKLLKPGFDESAATAFRREWSIASSIDRDSHLVWNRDLIQLDRSDGNTCMAIVMERLSSNLSDRLAEGLMDTSELGLLAHDIAWGLCALHEGSGGSVVHGDIKPSNIMLRDRQWKLGDFGIASALSATVGSGWGLTPRYAPPEMLKAMSRGTRLPISAAADVWSAGICLFEAAMGRHPVGLNLSTHEITVAVMSGDLNLDEPSLSDELVGVLHACLEYDPTRRPSARQFFNLCGGVGRASFDTSPDDLALSVSRVGGNPVGMHQLARLVHQIGLDRRYEEFQRVAKRLLDSGARDTLECLCDAVDFSIEVNDARWMGIMQPVGDDRILSMLRCALRR